MLRRQLADYATITKYSRFLSLAVLKIEKENSLTPKQQKVPDYRKEALSRIWYGETTSLESLVQQKSKEHKYLTQKPSSQVPFDKALTTLVTSLRHKGMGRVR